MKRTKPLSITWSCRPMSADQEHEFEPILECLISQMVESALDSLTASNSHLLEWEELKRINVVSFIRSSKIGSDTL